MPQLMQRTKCEPKIGRGRDANQTRPTPNVNSPLDPSKCNNLQQSYLLPWYSPQWCSRHHTITPIRHWTALIWPNNRTKYTIGSSHLKASSQHPRSLFTHSRSCCCCVPHRSIYMCGHRLIKVDIILVIQISIYIAMLTHYFRMEGSEHANFFFIYMNHL
jgi:hypothetical protein